MTLQDFSFTVHIFKEGETYVAYVPALDVSSCGATDEEARRNIRDAVRGFLATSADMGTLEEILREAGYEREGERWRAPEFVSVDQLTMSIK
jgi:predicted RNase H-like HicB family nuclease